MQKIDRTGEQNRANNGLMMTIVVYNNSHDLTIQFEDGVIVEHKSYANFLIGTISHPNINMRTKVSHIGETKTLPNGLTLTITNYRRHDDVDILQSDGVLFEHVDYKKFSCACGGHAKGYLHIGETTKAKNGMIMTIIAYRTNKDIDVQFEDGFIIEHAQYYNFKVGQIGHPNFYRLRPNIIQKNVKSRVGKTNYNSIGLLMTIIMYRNSHDIDIQFEDDTVIQHVSYQEFKLGSISHPKYQTLKTLTQQKYMNKIFHTRTGLAFSVDNYRNSHDLDILFETGYRKTIKHTSELAKDCISIKHPFPYQMGKICVEKPAYILNNLGNFYCHCDECGLNDIMTIEEMKDHRCTHE